MLQTHTFKLIWSQTKHAPDMPDTAPTTTQQSKPRAANPRVLQRTERLLEEGPAAVGVALKIRRPCRRQGAGRAGHQPKSCRILVPRAPAPAARQPGISNCLAPGPSKIAIQNSFQKMMVKSGVPGCQMGAKLDHKIAENRQK